MTNGMPLSAFLPSYQELFGELRGQNGDDSRSVYSPAAYLADLLELIDDNFVDPPLRERRPDLAGIPLNGENSYTELPYLDIVNEVLERRLGKDPYRTLQDLRFPLNLPFSLRTEQRRQYLRRFQVAPEELYRQFAIRVDADGVAQEFLGLPPGEADSITVAINGEPGRFTGLADAALFRRATTLSPAEVRELLYANLGPAQRAEATALFIHQGGTCVTLDDDEKRLVYGDGSAAIPEDWFDRVARMVRLARKTGMPLHDLDLVLRGCCQNQLDGPALRTIAAITVLRRGLDLPADVVCALVAPMNTLGLGDEDRQANLVKRVFGTPPIVAGDILAELNKPYRRWLAGVLPLTEPEIIAIVKRFRARKAPGGPFDRGDTGMTDLSLLYRIGCLTTALGIAVDELFGVLDALESDPSILGFPVPIDTNPSGADCYRMLDATDADTGPSLWLMQTLMVVVRWQRAHGLGSDELVRILGGAAAPATTEDIEEQREVGEQLRREFENVTLSADVFVSQRFSERAAGVIHRALARHPDGVVSRRDPRLLRVDTTVAEAVAYQGLVRLSTITEEDFLGLGLNERLTAKIFANLVILGYLDGTGVLVETRLTVADPGLATDFGNLRDAVFAVIGELCQGGPAAVYPSDLAETGDLTDTDLAELYDNLIFNAYLDPDGNVGDPGFFATPENVEQFDVNANLSTVEHAVFDLLRKRVESFKTKRIALDQEIFTWLEPADVLTSLRFNGYLGADDYYVDKFALAALPLADFGLALEFYPYRQRVLEAMRGQIEAARAAHLTFAPEDFQDVADRAVARRVVEQLADGYTVGGHVPEELRPGLSDPSPGLWLGVDFTEADAATVFHRVATLLLEQQTYQLDFTALADLGFTLDESAALVGRLITDGHLTDDLTVPSDKLAFFTNVHNALTFTLPDFADYGKDVFFLLFAVATELTSAVEEITGALADLAHRQLTTLFTVLQDAFGISGETVEATCLAVTGSGANALDVLVAPVLTTEGDVTDAHFRAAYRRVRRFALLIAKLALDAAEVGIAFQDQDLAGTFPEALALPPGVDHFDALLEDSDGTVHVFRDRSFWTYSAGSYALADPKPKALTELSARFAGISAVDSAFTDAAGTSWLVGHGDDGVSRAYTKERGTRHWTHREQLWGRIRNNFTDPERIDTAFVDDEGRAYLFCGDQYVRYSTPDYSYVDEGYPRTLGEWREDEGPHVRLATNFRSALDASFQGPDGRVHLFKEDRFLTVGGDEQPIAESWGQVRNAFDDADQVDAAYTDGATQVLFSGRHAITYANCLENNGVRVDDGSPKRIEALLGDVPPEFENAIDAALVDTAGVVHLFRDGKTVALTSGVRKVAPTAGRWGVLGPILPSGTVDAAFVGLDGKTYLFSGERYIRYAGADYSVVDAGYPRRINGDWGELRSVDAAFVLDGRTYLFGKVGETAGYVRYSTRDYGKPDDGYPKPLSDNWWNLPAELVPAFSTVDAVFTGRDNLTYLFSGPNFVVFDSSHRWWSEPRLIRDHWDSIPFKEHVDAAFLGSDGKTYVFSGGRYVRYSTADYTRVDDRYPAPIDKFWGNVVNNLARTGKVDATLVLDSPERRTYLFSGNQFVRYTGADLTTMDNGYPKNLTALKDEPRLGKLGVILDRVDAALADRHTVHLFSGRDWHVVSDASYRRHDLPAPSVGCAFVEDGSVLVAEADGWRRYSALEGTTVARTPVRPRTLRSVPLEFRDGLDAVLSGTDGNTYLFKGTDCFNTKLGHSYPLAQEWGRSRNNIYDDNRIDAAFAGRDGRTYVFSGDQFVVHGSVYPDAQVESGPRPVAEHWAGLDSVMLAYVHDGQTLLFEHPDADGVMRYAVYSGSDYTRPDEGYPTVTDATFWPIPDDCLPADFVAPDAVVTEGDTLLMITGENCLQFDEEAGAWNRPRPLDRIWPGLGEPELITAFTGRDKTTYFFLEDVFLSYRDRNLAPRSQIRDRWGRARNEFTGNVSAAVVVGDATFLFSGKQYVRYSGRDYRYVDPGYPKTIAANLRSEPEFATLPESFEDVIAERTEAGIPVLDAVIANDRNVHLLAGTGCHVISRSLTATYDIALLGLVRNNIVDKAAVDAALVKGEHTYLFSGDQYVRYTGGDYTFVDDGYPRVLESAPPTELGITAVPATFADHVDAAFHGADGASYLFAGKQYLRVDGSAPRPVTEQWGKVHNEFTDPTDPYVRPHGLDAAFVARDGALYAFRGGQFVRYQPGSLEFADEGNPRTIRDDWGDLPQTFELGITGAFSFEGRTYLVRGNEYVRYSGDTFAAVDRTYPHTFRERWANTADYRLTDIHTFVRFVDLARAHAPGVAQFLLTGDEDPYACLSGILGWDADELKWLQRHGGFVRLAERTSDTGLPQGGPKYRLELEFLLRAAEVFEVAGKLGSTPSRIFAEIWSPIYGERRTDTTVDGANTVLYGLLMKAHGVDEGKALAEEIRDELNLLRRDALVSAVTAGSPTPITTRDLFEYLLIDVDMGSAARTSKIREAIAAVQLYLHRCLLNLEDTQVREDNEEDARRRLKHWWTWMRAYRTWEANRKVFLYPENYLRPELRGTKTPAFQQLQDDLLQGEITNDAVLRAYKRYLDEYTEVSRLAIAGGYVYPKAGDDEQTRSLVLFGTTRTDPRRYYYRSAEVRGLTKLSTTWESWAKVGVQIDSDEVSPIHAYGRVFVFWAIPESSTPDGSSATITTTKDGDSQKVTSKPATNRVKICFSFCDLNGEWLPVQSRSVDTGLTGPMSGLKVSVQLTQGARTADPSGDNHESIVVTCTCLVGPSLPIILVQRWTGTFALPPELVLSQLSATALPVDITSLAVRDDAELRADLFDAGSANRINDARIVAFNSAFGDTSWFSIDHRGGSFLFRPSAALVDEDITTLSLKRSNKDRLPAWSRIDAAVELADGTRLFFSNSTHRFVSIPVTGDPQTDTIKTRFGPAGVSAAYLADGKLYLVSDDQLYRYTPDRKGDLPSKVDETYPQPLPYKVSAVFRRDSLLYVFDTEQRYARTDPMAELGTVPLVWRPIRGNWGGLPEAFESRFDTILDAEESLYLFLGSDYVQYDKAATFPRPYDRTALSYETVRLTTSTAHKLNERLLTGGVGALLDPRTQEYDEVPALSTTRANQTTVRLNKNRVDETQLPVTTHLDFDSANGIYYWEIFFHAPLLIAQALNGAQRFEDARQWYEYVFDPTQPASYWRFLPFLAMDPTALVDSARHDLFALAGCGPADAEVLTKASLNAEALHARLDTLLSTVDRIAPLFLSRRPPTTQQTADFLTLSGSTAHTEIESRMVGLPASLTDESRAALANLREKTALIAGLTRRYKLLGDPDKLINAYQNDPFDPHAIAALRPVAYRRAVVMTYVDNLLDWGDMLFRQYTPESVDEARMLYIFAYDLLGGRPVALGTRLLPQARTYESLDAETGELDLLSALTGDGALIEGGGEVHSSVANRYFSIPDNSVFADYWTRVEDRLNKIRLTQNILGISQPLPLFAPPIDPMALVEGVAAGADLSRIGAEMTGPVPHYRFAFVHRKAQELVDKLRQLGGDLLSVLERGDSEALGLLHNRQEGGILAMTRAIKDAQVRVAEEDLKELAAGRDGATKRLAYYEKLVNDGLSGLEVAQLSTMSFAAAAHLYSGANRIGAAFAYAMPQALLGPFIMGTEMGGKQAGKVFDKTSEIWESLGEGFQVVGELLGIRAGQERSMAEWRSQRDTAASDLAQINHQLAGAEQQLTVAMRERDILAQEIAHNQAEATFLTGKFSNAELYRWMSGRLADTYFQVYNLAYDMAKAAERAFQFERGDGDARFIRPSYWDSRRNGLLASDGLGLDLERLGTAYLEKGGRDLEITKPVSLLELDPVAVLRLKNDGFCEFSLTEALFDYDFPGHFHRQIRSMTVTFFDEEGTPVGVNATLSQLGHKTVLSADPKAVKYLLDPKGPVPAAVRADWRPGQRIALSPVDDGMPGNGLFELRYDDDRYLPFEGTGAVSTWRLELAARRPADPADVVITVRYTAEAGDPVFTNAVKGMLKTYPAARFVDVAGEFPDEWAEFLGSDEQSLTLPIGPELFPNMSSRQITGIYPKYELTNGGSARFVLNGDTNISLTDGKLVPTPGLRLRGDGDSGWTLRLDGDKQALTNLGLVLTYKAGV